MSKKDGLPVKKPKGKAIIPAEIIAEELPTQETFDIDQVEKELRDLDKEGSFLDQLFKSSDERTLKQLKIKKEITGARHNLRQDIIDIEKQRISARRDLLALKADLLEKEVMSDVRIQKTLLDIKLTELNIRKLRTELEELDLIQKKEERKKELNEDTSSEENYTLKVFENITKAPEEQGGNEENG